MSKQAKIIPFPYNKPVVDAHNLISIDDEIQYLLQRYDTDSSVDTFKQLMHALRDNFQEDMALHLCEHYYPNIATEINEQLDALYIQLLLDCFEVNRAETILQNKYKMYQSKQLDTFDLLQLFNTIEQINADIACDTLAELTTIFNAIDHVAQLNFFEQRELLAQLNLITTIEDYHKAVTKLLNSEQFHALLKAYLIEILRNKKCCHTIQMNWYGQMKVVEFDQIKSFEENGTLAKLNRLIDNFCIDDFEKDVLKQNGFLYLTLLYPFIEEVVVDVKQFADALLQKHQGKPHQEKWFAILEKEISKMEIKT